MGGCIEGGSREISGFGSRVQEYAHPKPRQADVLPTSEGMRLNSHDDVLHASRKL